jgi:hypothetical protein
MCRPSVLMNLQFWLTEFDNDAVSVVGQLLAIRNVVKDGRILMLFLTLHSPNTSVVDPQGQSLLSDNRTMGRAGGLDTGSRCWQNITGACRFLVRSSC